MTKHRKILEGVSEGPWEYEDGNIFQGDSSDLVASYFENDADGNFVGYAYEKWPAICDLIDATTSLLSRPPPEKGYDIEIDQDFVDGWFLAKEALDKLNED